MIRSTVISAATALSLLWGGVAPATAGERMRVEDVVQVTFLPGWREQSGGRYAGIRIDLATGWKTYWRAPGDGGIPTTIDWDGSENIRDARLFWPRPSVFRISGLRSVGYKKRVVIPVYITPVEEGAIRAQMLLRLGVCKEICFPVELTLRTELTATEAAGEDQIRAALADRPKQLDAQVSCRLVKSEDGYRLDFAAILPQLPGQKETAVLELADPGIWVSEPHYIRQGEQVTGSVRMIPQTRIRDIDLSALRMTVLTTSAAIEVRGCDG